MCYFFIKPQSSFSRKHDAPAFISTPACFVLTWGQKDGSLEYSLCISDTFVVERWCVHLSESRRLRLYLIPNSARGKTLDPLKLL